MCASDKKTCIDIARDTEIFSPEEIRVLTELLDDSRNNPDTSYIFIEETEGGNTVGFAIFGRIPMTEFSWDIYWIVVGRNFQSRGIGTRLLRQIEDFIVRENRRAIIRVETSTDEWYSAARNFYRKMGFAEVGVIPDFYGENDDLVTFCKRISIPQDGISARFHNGVSFSKIDTHALAQ
ncbi:MAG: hypothetical protein A2Z72_02740 [Omnitrophica bacterium RBG_13_46_9]|nr:MAG: hypothetical protein A2Z72_02740 [Omnitrophica bacterium RBG_13_46_9]